MPSHTATGEWKSFEIRMRYRRAERLLARAEVAANARLFAAAREALSEARRLAPDLPRLPAVEQSIQAIEDAATVTRRDHPRAWGRYAAIMVMVLATIGVLWTVQRPAAVRTSMSGPAIVTTPPPTAAQVPIDAPPSHVTVEQRPITVSEVPLGPPPQVIEAARMSEPPAEQPHTVSVVAPTGRRADEMSVSTIGTVAPLPAADVSEPPQPLAATPTPVAAVPVASLPPAARSAVEKSVLPGDDALVQRTLNRYATAYSQLDADAAQHVWPTVNRGALERAFEGLAVQQVSLGTCRIDVQGEAARAACAGTETWTPKIGDHASHTQPRNWTFTLAKAGTEWQIVSARVQNK